MDGLIIWCVIGIVAGFLAGQIWKGGGFGLLGDLVIGLVGSVLGGALFGRLVPAGGLVGAIIVATLGALVLLFLIRLVKKA